MLNRRNWLQSIGGLAVTCLIPLSKAQAQAKLIASVTLTFDDGDEQVIWFTKKGDKLYCVGNKLNHYEIFMRTEIETSQYNSKLGLYEMPVEKMIITYEGKDSNGNVVYRNTGSKKVWKDHENHVQLV